tara:strand:+ start:339 stop:758 length:420 start_codon:yes stop_codon:yes gene_type:complete
MADMQDITKNVNIVKITDPIDYNDGVPTSDYIHMSLYDAVEICAYQGTEGDAVTVTVTQCTQDADAGGDSKAFSSSKDITVAANSIVTVNITGADFDAQNNFDWIKCAINDPGSAAVGCVFALCYRARYAEATMPSATA